MRWFVVLIVCGLAVLAHIGGVAFAAPRGGYAAVLWATDLALWAGMFILALLRIKKEAGA